LGRELVERGSLQCVREQHLQAAGDDDDGDGDEIGWADPLLLEALVLGCDAVPRSGSVSSAGKVARK